MARPKTKPLTVADIAALQLVSVDVVRAWIRSGELPATNVTSTRGTSKPRWRVSAADYAAFVESRASKGVPKRPAKRVTTHKGKPIKVIEFIK